MNMPASSYYFILSESASHPLPAGLRPGGSSCTFEVNLDALENQKIMFGVNP